MRFLIIGVLFMVSLALVILYSALVVGSDADDEEEEYWRKRGG